ncbi:hypothetical protein E2F47_06085 [Mycobacterium eburneum]|nr:hypothetical protein [Mycobacterium eburneum]TDH56696.1 hypothetical protein E2F47_06085 [Mycobacterium eburneum]
MTPVMAALYRARALAWAALVPAFELAIEQARACEWMATRLSNEVGRAIPVAYPDWVQRMAAAGVG